MSGGSYDYAFGRIETLADEVEHRTKAHPTAMGPLRLAFVAHLRLVAAAMHAIEWVDSCDWGPGDEEESIRKALGPGATGAELDVTIDRAREALDALAVALKSAEEKRQET